MKLLNFFLNILVILPICAKCQISITPIKEVMSPKRQFNPYFGNYTPISEEFIGQTLYLKPLKKEVRIDSYGGFFKEFNEDFNRNKKNVYKCCQKTHYGSHVSIYDSLDGRYFEVLNVAKRSSPIEEFLKLKNISNNEIVFYYLSPFQTDNNFPFIVQSFLDLKKKEFVQKKFVMKYHLVSKLSDLETGKPITLWNDTELKCIEITLDERDYELSCIFETPKKEKFLIPIKNLKDDINIFNSSRARYYRDKFGSKIWERILNGHVDFGFTTEMCGLAKGLPTKKNVTTKVNTTYEQWIYDTYGGTEYFYFEDDKLVTKQ